MKRRQASYAFDPAAISLDLDGRVRWFGPESWGATICDPLYRMATPVGSVCYRCGCAIEDEDEGLATYYHDAAGTFLAPMHLGCFMLSILPSSPSRH
jgi:hypothetical protein